MVIGTVAIFLLMHKTGKSIVLRNLGIGSIISAAGALGLAALCAAAGTWMESHLHGFSDDQQSLRHERRTGNRYALF